MYMLSDFNLKRKDYILILALTIFSIVLVSYYINFNQHLGIYCSDVYLYLLNALYFTGVNINSVQTIYLSPIICFLTSILFDIGIKDNLAIFIITGLFAIIGNIGLYILLKMKFNELMSFTGVILFSTFSINLTWLANGSLDIPAVSMTIWIMVLSFIAIHKNPKYYLIAFPTFAIGFFTRYTVILIIPVLILCYLYNKGFKIGKNDLNYMIKGIILTIMVSAIILIPILIMGNGNFGASSQISGGISGTLGSNQDLAYNTDKGYYISNFMNFISSSKVIFENRTPVLENSTFLSYLIIGILAIGTLLYLIKKKFEFNNKNQIIGAILLFSSVLTFGHLSSFITIILVFMGLMMIGRNIEEQTDMVMLGWILVYLIFFSYYDIKVNRYIIPIIPPLIYFILSSINLIHEKIKINGNIIPIILIFLFVIQAGAFCYSFEDTNQFKTPEEISQYIIENIPEYNHEKIGSYNTRIYNWYLKNNVTAITSNTPDIIIESNVSYYISDIPQNDLNSYEEIKNINNIYLYKKLSV